MPIRFRTDQWEAYQKAGRLGTPRKPPTSPGKLAEALGTGVETVKAILTGETPPTPGFATKFSEYLGVAWDEFFEEMGKLGKDIAASPGYEATKKIYQRGKQIVRGVFD